MKKVKITVLKREVKEDLAKEYGCPGLGPCARLKDGQVFYAGADCPPGLCNTAWKCMHQYIFALQNGAESFFFDNWCRHPRTAIACCNDGFRPVYFKLEATDEDIPNPEPDAQGGRKA